MRSNFSRTSTKITATSRPFVDETYDLRGLNLVLPDQVKPNGESPFAINFRMYAREEDDTRVAIRTRRGTQLIGDPYGQAMDFENNDTQTGDLAFSPTKIVAQPFTAGADGATTRLDFEIKKSADATGHILVHLCADNGGIPGQLIGSSSILSSDVTTDYEWLSSYLMDAPNSADTVQYWALLYVQDNGSGEYYVRQTADAGALDLESTDGQETWHSIGASFRVRTFVTPDEPVKGFHRRYPSNGNKRTLVAAGENILEFQDNGTITVVDSGLDAGAEKVRFTYTDDKSLYCNGINAPKQFDGTSSSVLTGAPVGAELLKIHQGRVFALTDKVLFRFSELYDPNSWPSVNFFYVPDPKSNDPVTGARTFQDNFLIFTHETKHIIFGNDISTFTRKEAIGTKGAVSDEAIAVDRNYCFFMADDGQIYAYNGSTDILCSDKMEPEFTAIPDKSKVRLELYRNQLRVYYPSSTSAYNNRMAVLDLTYSNFSSRDFRWYKDTGKHITGGLEWNQDNDNPFIEFSSRVPWMFRADQGGSDLGKPIDFKYWTAYKNYGSGASKKRVKRFRPIVRTVDADYTLSVGKDMDFADDPDMRAYIVSGGGAKWGSFVWGDGTKFGKNKFVDKPAAMSGRGRHIQYRFEREGVETPVELYGYISQVKIGRPK